ncbi:MAG: hypothetical protein Q4A97_10160, partial [Comamonadaceae bacterium]|nr:hypothetical protein [Comamonadaceae bacterium]
MARAASVRRCLSCGVGSKYPATVEHSLLLLALRADGVTVDVLIQAQDVPGLCNRAPWRSRHACMASLSASRKVLGECTCFSNSAPWRLSSAQLASGAQPRRHVPLAHRSFGGGFLFLRLGLGLFL